MVKSKLPYNYIWLNTLTVFTKVNNNFELDYWGVSTKEISNYFTKNENLSNECIISNRNRGIKDFGGDVVGNIKRGDVQITRFAYETEYFNDLLEDIKLLNIEISGWFLIDNE